MFVSYSDDSVAHAKRVLELAQWLRSHGVDATIDQFEESPQEGWPRWVYSQIRESEFVLIIATPGYLRRCEHDEPRADATGSTVKFGSHLTLQELHEAGGRNRKFIPVLFGRDAIVESVPLPLRGATCYRLPDQRDDLYRRLTGQPKVQRAPLGVLKTFDDETLGDTVEEPATYSEALGRGRTSLDEQHAEDSLQAIVDAGLIDEHDRDDTRPRKRRGRARRNRQQWFSVAAFAAAFLSVGLFLAQQVLEPEVEPTCRIQLTHPDGSVIEGIDRVDLELPSGHLLEVVIEGGRTLRFACPQERVQVQAHVFLDATESAKLQPPNAGDDGGTIIDGRIALPAGVEIGDDIAQAQLVPVRPPRAITPKPNPDPGSNPDPSPSQPEPDPADPVDPEVPVEVGGVDAPAPSKPPKRTPKVKPISENPELQTRLSDQILVFQRCYEQGLANDPTLRGKIIGDVRTDPTGRVVDFEIIENDFSRSNREVASCIRKEIESWKVGKPKNPRGVVDRISIDFAPAT